MVHSLSLFCLTAFAFFRATVSAAPEMKTVPESYISLFPLTEITVDTTGLEKLANQFRPSVMAPVFLVYRTGNRRDNPVAQSSFYNIDFKIEKDFPEDAPEIACIVTGGGSGHFRETVLFYQRKKDHPGGWKKMYEFFLQDPCMPWNAEGITDANACQILLTRNGLIITVGNYRRVPYGIIQCRFQLEQRNYKNISINYKILPIIISGKESKWYGKFSPLYFHPRSY